MKKALGRGLESLIPDKIQNEIKDIKIENIVPNEFQPRVEFNENSIAEMALSIKEQGLLQPVVVTKKGSKYMLIAGERRWRSAKKAGLKSIPCIEKEIEQEDILTISLIENIQREDLSPVEEANAYDRMIKEFNMTQEDISRKIGKSRSTIANTIRILSLPEDLISLLNNKQITAGHARALLMVKDTKKRKMIAEKIIKESLTVREAENLASIAEGKIKKIIKSNVAYQKSPEIKNIENRLEKSLGTKVNIKINNSKSKDKKLSGDIIIQFYSLDDMERLLDLIW